MTAIVAEKDGKSKWLLETAQKLLAADYFTALGVAKTASPDEVKKAFLEAIKTWHPDRVPAGLEDLRPVFTKVFGRLELARGTLTDPTRRARYVEELTKPVTSATGSDLTSAEANLEFRKAEVLIKKNDLVQAEQHLRRAVGLSPSNADFLVALVSVQVKADTPKEKLRELGGQLDVILAREPKHERGFFCRAQIRKRLDLMPGAMADFAMAASLNPQNVDAAREVRIHKMRQDQANPGAKSKDAASGGEDGAGPLGFFRKLFKR